MNHVDHEQDDLLDGYIHQTPALEAYEFGDVTDQLLEEFTVEADEDGELIRVEVYSLADDDEQEYAKELRRCCGDDVAAEELS